MQGYKVISKISWYSGLNETVIWPETIYIPEIGIKVHPTWKELKAIEYQELENIQYFGGPCHGKSSVHEIDVDASLVQRILRSVMVKENADENLASTIKSFCETVSVPRNVSPI